MVRLNGQNCGAVRVEYLIAGIICVPLLLGMAAVLLQYHDRLSAGQSPKPMAMASEDSASRKAEPAPQAAPPRAVIAPVQQEAARPVETSLINSRPSAAPEPSRPAARVIAPEPSPTAAQAAPEQKPTVVVRVKPIEQSKPAVPEVKIVQIAQEAKPTQVAVQETRGAAAPETVNPAPKASAVAVLPRIAREDFEDVTVGGQPPKDAWTWSKSGQVTVQLVPGGNDKCLRLVDNSQGADCWVHHSFAAQSEAVKWYGYVRFASVADNYRISLSERDKQAVLITTHDDQIGYQDEGGKWHELAKYQLNQWYSLRIEADVRARIFRFFVNNEQKGGESPFRNSVGYIDGWTGGMSQQLVSTLYFDHIKIEGR